MRIGGDETVVVVLRRVGGKASDPCEGIEESEPVIEVDGEMGGRENDHVAKEWAMEGEVGVGRVGP